METMHQFIKKLIGTENQVDDNASAFASDIPCKEKVKLLY